MKIKQGLKRKVALFLSGVLLMQTAFSGAVGAARERSLGEAFDIKDKTPAEVFENLTIQFDDSVGDAGTAFGFRLNGRLDDEYVEKTFYEKFYDLEEIDGKETMDLPDWIEANGSDVGFDEYLNGQTVLEEITFSVKFRFPEGTLDAAGVEGDLKTGGSSPRTIGTYNLQVSGETATLTGTLNKMVWGRSNVSFQTRVDASLNSTYKTDTVVTVTPGGESEDFVVRIPESEREDVAKSGYKIDKKASCDDNRTIVYSIHAYQDTSLINLLRMASQSALASDDKIASEGEWDEEETAKPLTRKEKKRLKAKQRRAALAASGAESGGSEDDAFYDDDRELDPENDEDWEYDGDGRYHGPGLFTALIDRLTPEQYQRLAASNGNLFRESDFNLKGKTIYDKLPADLELVSVERKIGESKQEIFKKEEGGQAGFYYEIEEGVLTYIIDDEAESIDEAWLTITMRVPDSKYNEYMGGLKGVEWIYNNRVLLQGEDDKLLAVSKPVETKITLPAPFLKDGYAVAGSGGQVEWVLTVNSFFSNSGVKLWAVDHIEDVGKTHNYVVGSDMLTVAGKNRNIVKIASPFNDATYSYENIMKVTEGKIRVDRIEQFIREFASNAGSTDAVAYEYKVSEEQTDAVMLIPLSTNKNHEIEIVYRTKAVLGDGFEDMPTDGKPVILENFAGILWRWPDGEGPGPGYEFGGAEINKGCEVLFTLINKTSGGYAVADNTITWNFELNQVGVDATNVRIEDEFDTTQQQLLEPGVGTDSKLVLTQLDKSGNETSTKREIPYEASEPVQPSGDYYTVDKTTATGKEKLIIFLDTLNGNDRYKFTVKTLVTDLQPPATGKKEITNSATIEATVGTETLNQTTNAECEVSNNLIEKSAIPVVEDSKDYMYNYKDSTVKWRVKINPNSWTIKDVNITDTLPDGTHFAELTGAWYGGDDLRERISYTSEEGGNATSPSWTPDAPPKGTYAVEFGDTTSPSKIEVKQTGVDASLDFNFLASEQISKPFIFEFTTHVRADKRAEFRTQEDATLINKATMTGNAMFAGKELLVTAGAEATNTFKPEPLKKAGQYVPKKEVTVDKQTSKDASAIDWEIYVNRAKANMKGAEVTDTIQDFMELLPDTMEVWIVDLDKKGTASERTKIYPSTNPSELSPFAPIDHSGFTYTIPNANAAETLKFKFTTVLIDDADAAEMTNQVSVKWGDHEDSTTNVKAEGAANFRVADYATADIYFARVYKTSQHENKKFPLKGAEFKISELKSPAPDNPEDSKDPTKWTVVKDKVRKSNRKGNVSFMFLKPDTMYKIEETNAPAGYELIKGTDFCWYVVPRLVDKDINDFPNKVINDQNNTDGKKHSVYVETGEKYYPKFDVKNTPSGLVDENGKALLSFKKVGQGGQILKGVKFTAKSGSQLTYKAESDADGIVTFKELDPLSDASKFYTIEEKTPAGYRAKDLKLKAQVYIDENGDTVAQFMPDSALTTDPTIGDHVLKNEVIEAGGSFKKVDQNGENLLDEVIFDVYRRGDGGQRIIDQGNNSALDKDKMVIIDVDNDTRISADNKNSYDNPYLPCKTLTSIKGIVTIPAFVYGDYKLVERLQGDLLLPGDPAQEAKRTLYLKVDASGAKLSLTGADGSFKPANEQFTFENQIQYGFLEIEKVVGDWNTDGTKLEVVAGTGTAPSIPLSGIKFHIYRDINNNGNVTDAMRKNPYLTLTTNAKGQFDVDATTGYYTQSDTAKPKKQLTVGKYILEEQESDTYCRNTKLLTFEIEKQTVTSDNPFVPIKLYPGLDTIDETQTQYLNEPKRGGIMLTKKDEADYNPDMSLSGAKFEIHAKNSDYVANLTESGTTGIYVFTKPDSKDKKGKSSSEKDGDGKSYLRNVAGTSAPEDYRLLYGNYDVKEIAAPDGYSIPEGGFEIIIKDDTLAHKETDRFVKTEIKNNFITQNVQIHKLVEKRKVNGAKTVFDGYSSKAAGFEFTLSAVPGDPAHPGEANRPSGSESDFSKTTTTGEDGLAVFKDVPVGSYLLKETENELFMPMPDITVTVTKNEVSYKLANAVSGGNTAIPETLVSENATGTVTVDPAEDGSMPALRVRNNYNLGGAEGKKVGVQQLSSTQSVPIAGVKFTLTKDTEPMKGLKVTLQSDSSGKISATDIPYGTYTLMEDVETTPAGYKSLGQPITVIIDKEHVKAIIESDGASQGSVENLLLKKSLKFAKTDQHGKRLDDTLAQKISFSIVRDQNSIPASLPGDYVLPSEIKLNGDGYVVIEDLPYGSYTITENSVTGDGLLAENPNVSLKVKIEKAAGGTMVSLIPISPGGKSISRIKPDNIDPDPFVDNALFDFTASDGFKLKNSLKHGEIQIYKTLGEFDNAGEIKDLNNGSGLNGAKFEIYQKIGNESQPASDAVPYITLVTEAGGKFVSNDGWYRDVTEPNSVSEKQLFAGNYFFKEIVLDGFRPLAPGSEYTEFEVYDSETGYVTSFTHDGKGIPKVSKVLKNTPAGTFYNIQESGNIEGYKFTQDDTDTRIPLRGARFKLTSQTYPSYPIKYITSDSTGKISYKELPLGTYKLEEVEAPDGYAKSGEIKTIELSVNKETVSLDINGDPIEFMNEAAGTLPIEKQAQIIANGNITGAMRPGAGFLFKVTGQSLTDGQKLEEFITEADITGADQVEIRSTGTAEDGLYITTGSAGKVTIKNLPVGSYRVQEQINEKNDAAGSYRPDTTEYTADITINHTTGKVSAPEVKVDNLLGRGKLQGIKTTSDKTTPLAGAVIGLFPAGATSFTEADLWCGQKITTGEDGMFLFENLPYGTYLIKELEAPSGYHLNTTTVYEAVVSDEAVIKTTGLLIEGGNPKAEQETQILIANTKKPSGGGGGGGGGGGSDKPPTPTGPGPGTPTIAPDESSPANPGESLPENPGETAPLNPLPTLPVESAPEGGTDLIIPPDTPPGSDLEIRDPDGNTIFKGTVGDNGRVNVDLLPGTYTLVTFDENQVPLGSMTFTIEDPYTPLGMLAAPDAGDHSVPFVVLAVLMIASLAGMILVIRKKSEEKRKKDGTE